MHISNPVILICFFGFRVISSADITLKNNGYENVLVAISSDVKEDPKIIERIKTIFTDASKNMFEATHRRAFFRNVTILVPGEWKKKSEYKKPASGQISFEKAALRIDKADPAYGDNPYTRSYGKCGVQALYIHLTPNYLLAVANMEKDYGPTGKVVVHEWAHYRWGVFDEYPTTNERYYIHKDAYEPVRCHYSIPGKHKDKNTDGKCKINKKTKLPDANCRFHPDTDQKSSTASYMYRQSLKNIKDFCDDGTLGDKNIIHNSMAPNDHNKRCSHKSVWEVMRETEDFKNNRNPPASSATDTTPSFRLVQRKDDVLKVVLLFDVSGSMRVDSYRPLTMMRQAATNFIDSIIAKGSYVGIATFSHVVRTVIAPTQITKLSDRTRLISLIPKTAAGATYIGNGMARAMNVLLSKGVDWARGGNVILMSDGKNTGGMDRIKMIKEAIKYGITFFTIAYSAAADPMLEKIASDTGGQSFFSTSSATSASLFTSLSAIAQAADQGSRSTSSSSVAPVSVLTSSRILGGLTTMSGEFAIDFTIGTDTRISFNYITRSASIAIRLVSPSGSVTDKTSRNYQLDTVNQLILIRIQGVAEKGIWNYTVISLKSVSTAVLVNVLSKASAGKGGPALPITVKSWTGEGKATLASGPAAQITIFAQVSRGYTPVLGLNVKAVLHGSNGKKKEVFLQDGGFGHDLRKNDGIYSGFIGRHDLNIKGRYSIGILMDNSKKTGHMATYAKSSSAPYVGPEAEPPRVPFMYQPIGAIQRVASAGELKVEAPVSSGPPKDVVPPPRIRDLQTVSLDTEELKVNLTWTAVPDDASPNNRTIYDLRIGTFEDITGKFGNTSKINLPGTPRNPGDIEEHTIDMSTYSKNETHYLALRVIDEAGNEGEPSNVVSVALVPPKKFSNGDEIDDGNEIDDDEDTGWEWTDAMIINVSVGVGVFTLFGLLVLIVCCCHRHKKTPPPASNEPNLPTTIPRPSVHRNADAQAARYAPPTAASSQVAYHVGVGEPAPHSAYIHPQGGPPPYYNNAYDNRGYIAY